MLLGLDRRCVMWLIMGREIIERGWEGGREGGKEGRRQRENSIERREAGED